jgi:hypothetical protein
MPDGPNRGRGPFRGMRLHGKILLAGHLLALGTAAQAQSVRGKVTVSGGGDAVVGAVMLLVDSLSQPVGRTLSREGGEFILVAPAPGQYRIRVLRIGFAPTEEGPFLIPSGGTSARQIAVSGRPIRLESVKVSATRQCLVRPDSTQAAFVVWEEARKALAAASVTQASRPTVHLRRYDRLLDAAGVVVQREDAHEERGESNRPFVSVSTDTLSKQGFVRHEASGTTYSAPDADVLLSAWFADTHCLRLATTTNGGEELIGVQFSPVEERDGLADISGTLWVDRSSAELRTMDFRYTNQPGVSDGVAGGELEFLRLPNGAWTVGRWQIRMPVLRVREGGTLAPAGAFDKPGRLERRRVMELAAVQVAGGEVLDVGWHGRTIWSRQPRTLVVRLVDSLTSLPLDLVHGSVEGLDRTFVTDGAGTASIAGLPPGSYDISFQLPLLDSLAVGPFRVRIVVNDSAATSRLVRAPSRSSALVDACGADALSDAKAVLVGTVVDGATGSSVPYATVRATWRARFARLAGGFAYRAEQHDVSADSAGRYRICEVPRDTPLLVAAQKGAQAGVAASFRIPTDRALAGLRLTLGKP